MSTYFRLFSNFYCLVIPFWLIGVSGLLVIVTEIRRFFTKCS